MSSRFPHISPIKYCHNSSITLYLTNAVLPCWLYSCYPHGFCFQRRGLAYEDEQPLEGAHKLERKDRETAARKTSLLDNLTGVFTSQNARSDPVVGTFDRLFLFCSRCKCETDHTARLKSCPSRESFGDNLDIITDDQLLTKLIIPKDEPEPEEQLDLVKSW